MSLEIHFEYKKKNSKGDHVGHATTPFWLPLLRKNLFPPSSGQNYVNLGCGRLYMKGSQLEWRKGPNSGNRWGPWT